MAKIYLPQIDEDTREALNKVFYGASRDSIASLRRKGVTANCEVILSSVGDGYAIYRVNGEMMRANFATASDRRCRAKVRKNRVLTTNSSIELGKYVDELNKKLAIRIQLFDNIKKARQKLKQN